MDVKVHPFKLNNGNINNMGFLYYNEVDKASQKYYPDWNGAKPNLETFLNALNLS